MSGGDLTSSSKPHIVSSYATVAESSDTMEEDEGDVYVDPNDETIEILDETATDDTNAILSTAAADMDIDGNDVVSSEDVKAEDDDNMERKIEDMSSAVINVHSDSVYAVSVRFDRAAGLLTVASGGGDDSAYISRLNFPSPSFPPSLTFTSLKVCSASDSISATSFANASDILVTGAFDGFLALFSVSRSSSSFAQIGVLEGPPDVEFISHHPTGDVVLIGCSDGTAWMYSSSTKNQNCMQVFVGHEGALSTGAFTADGRSAITAGIDGTVRVWAPKTGMCKKVFGDVPHGATVEPLPGVHSLVVGGGAERQLVLAGRGDGTAWVLHVGKKAADVGRIVGILVHSSEASDEDEENAGGVEAVGFCNAEVNPNWCATGGLDGIVKVWDLTNLSCRHTCAPPRNEYGGGITKLCWHAWHPTLYTSSSDGVVRLWDARSGACKKTLTGHTDMINTMDILHLKAEETMYDEVDIITTGSDDKTVRVFIAK
mmetsp:Transcript_21311/g.48395  ORF Transcript_21311/g.48395 Transcript_21311/m.48395 type:complete len:487 (-) Transcript_21311:129-1589(-)